MLAYETRSAHNVADPSDQQLKLSQNRAGNRPWHVGLGLTQCEPANRVRLGTKQH